MESVIIYRSFASVLINLTICILLLPGMNLEFENPRYRRTAGASSLLSLECRTFNCGVCSGIWLLLPGLNGHGCFVEMCGTMNCILSRFEYLSKFAYNLFV
jgi:hypothetical protein